MAKLCNLSFKIERLYYDLFAIFVVIVSSIIVSPRVFAQVGIDASGGLSTNVKFEVPPFYQIEPVVGISYHSSSAPGLAGAGWSLDAGSQIVRRSATRGLALMDSTDHYWLDGQELIPCVSLSNSPSCTTAQSAFGKIDHFYSTRIESFRRIAMTLTGWTVTEPDGTESFYSSHDFGASFQIDLTRDTFGNRVEYEWSCSQSCELNAISYGGSSLFNSGTYIKFHHEERPDPWLERNGRGSILHNQRLRSVTIYNNFQLLRAYKLQYAESLETRSSILTSVQQYGNDASFDASGLITAGATPPLPAKTFKTASLSASGNWQLDTEISNSALLNVATPLTTPLSPRYPGPTSNLNVEIEYDPDGGSGDPKPLPNNYVIGDFDGDGRVEVTTWALRNSPSYHLPGKNDCLKISFLTYRTDGSSVLPAANRSLLPSVGHLANCTPRTNVKVMTADHNGDNMDDLIVAIGREIGIYYARGNGRFFKGQVEAWNDKTAGCVTSDIDGDGRDDLICEDPSTHQLIIRRASPTGWLTNLIPTNSCSAPEVSLPCLPDHSKLTLASGDVDGDGLDDVILARPDGATSTRVVFGRSKGNGNFAWNEEQSFPFVGDFHTADFNNDAKLDLFWSEKSTGRLSMALAFKGNTTGRWTTLNNQTTPLKDFTLADVDGDGNTDLVGRVSSSGRGYDIKVQRSRGDGYFFGVDTSVATCDSFFTAVLDIVAADWNGDGLADPTCIANNEEFYSVTEQPSQPVRTDQHNWRRSDIDGDGRLEMVYIEFRNPGYIVHIVVPQTSQHISFPVNPASVTSVIGSALHEADTRRWIVADFGSLTGPADGKEDLALVEQIAGRQIVTTLLSTGLGTFSMFQQDVGAAEIDSPLGWFAADVNNDGRSSLIRTIPGFGRTSGMRVEKLMPVSAGRYDYSILSYFGSRSVAPMIDHSVRGFKPADLNGDGLTDLVQLDSANGPTVIRTLRADGHGNFIEAATTPVGVDLIGPRGVRVGDLDGDGTADLYHLASGQSGQCLNITHLAGDGRGGFSQGSYSGSGCVMSNGSPFYQKFFEDSASVILTDLDHDGRAELLHISQVLDGNIGTQFVVSRFRHDLTGTSPEWRVSTFKPTLSINLGDTWSWLPYRDPVSGENGLSYINGGVSQLLRWKHVSDEITTIENGLGLVSTIKYAPYTSSRNYLPSGYVPRIVSKVTTTDISPQFFQNQPIDNIEYQYSGATWSNQLKGLLGFTQIQSNDGRKVLSDNYLLSDSCGKQINNQNILDQVGAILTSSSTTYQPPGTTAPYRCLATSISASQCERTNSCRIAVKHNYEYDDYGNVVNDHTTADQAKPYLIQTSFVVNPTAYIVNKPSVRTTYDGKQTNDPVLAITNFGYDNELSTQPIKGALTGLSIFDDQTHLTLKTHYQYDAHGNQIGQTTQEGRITTVTFDPLFSRFPIKVCNALHCQLQSWNYNLGVPISTTDSAGVTTTTEYDAFGRVIKVNRADGGFTATKYLDFGVFTGRETARQRIRTEISDGSQGDGILWSESYFDGTGRSYRTTREGDATTTKIFADGSDRPIQVSEIHDANTKPDQWKWTLYNYDGLGRLIKTTHPDGKFSESLYMLGKFATSDEQGTKQTNQIDGNGRTISITDHEGNITTSEYDSLGRLIEVTDALGNKNQFKWSSRGLQTSTTDPDRGTRLYSYTQDGQLAKMTDAKKQIQTWQYDNLGRIKERGFEASGNKRIVYYDYDDDGQSQRGSSKGRLIHITDKQNAANISDDYWYDDLGRVNLSQRCIDTKCMSESVGFDLAGRIAVQSYPDSQGQFGAAAELVAYDYDDAGRLLHAGRYATFGYYQNDQIEGLTFGNNISTHFSYDPFRHWLDAMLTTNPAGNIAKYEYDYYPAGRIKNVNSSGLVNSTLNYEYDKLGRVAKVNSSDPAKNESFDYDEIGRIQGIQPGGKLKYGDTAHIHAMTNSTTGETRQYDANGNAISIFKDTGSLSMSWSVDDRLEHINDGIDHNFIYDIDGRRVKKQDKINGATYYFGPRLEIDDKGHFTKSYLAGDRLLARNTDGVVSYFHQDIAHNVRIITDDTGNVINNYEYSAFGKPYGTGGTSLNDITFASARTDAALGLITMGARTYDPTYGQFLSADSVIPSLSRPQSLNRYSYVENDPVNHWDPSGHMRLLIELRKLRIEETPQLMSIDEFVAGLPRAFGVYIDRGPSIGDIIKIMNRNYKESHPTPPPMVTVEEADQPYLSDPTEWASYPTATVGGGSGSPGSVSGLLASMVLGAAPNSQKENVSEEDLTSKDLFASYGIYKLVREGLHSFSIASRLDFATSFFNNWRANAVLRTLNATAPELGAFEVTVPLTGTPSTLFLAEAGYVGSAGVLGFTIGIAAVKADSYVNEYEHPFLNKLLASSNPISLTVFAAKNVRESFGKLYDTSYDYQHRTRFHPDFYRPEKLVERH